jgi:hypothetical protein
MTKYRDEPHCDTCKCHDPRKYGKCRNGHYLQPRSVRLRYKVIRGRSYVERVCLECKKASARRTYKNRLFNAYQRSQAGAPNDATSN